MFTCHRKVKVLTQLEILKKFTSQILHNARYTIRLFYIYTVSRLLAFGASEGNIIVVGH